MPGPRKPTELLQLSGAFKQNPQRAREVGPKSTEPLGDPPATFQAPERAIWYELVGNAPTGVLTSTERPILEVLSLLMLRLRTSWPKAAELALILNCLVQLGWTPSARSRVVGTPQEAPTSPWDDIGGMSAELDVRQPELVE